MKKLTLRQARKLESKISSRTSTYRYVGTDKFKVELDPYDVRPVRDLIDIANVVAMREVSSQKALIALRFKIRRTIQEKNEEVGINWLITERRMSEEIRRLIEAILRTSRGFSVVGSETTVEAVSRRLKSIAGTDSTYSAVTVAALSESDIQSLEKTATTLTNRIESIEEELNSLNSRTFIELSDADLLPALEADII